MGRVRIGRRGGRAGRGRSRGGSRGRGGRWIQKAIKRPGRVKRFLARKYGKEAFTKSGEIKQQYVIKAISDVKRTMPPGKKRRSLLAALNLAKRLETIGRGKRGK